MAGTKEAVECEAAEEMLGVAADAAAVEAPQRVVVTPEEVAVEVKDEEAEEIMMEVVALPLVRSNRHIRVSVHLHPHRLVYKRNTVRSPLLPLRRLQRSEPIWPRSLKKRCVLRTSHRPRRWWYRTCSCSSHRVQASARPADP